MTPDKREEVELYVVQWRGFAFTSPREGTEWRETEESPLATIEAARKVAAVIAGEPLETRIIAIKGHIV